MSNTSFRGYRFPPDVIRQAVMMYVFVIDILVADQAI
jgi:hypothetical protein